MYNDAYVSDEEGSKMIGNEQFLYGTHCVFICQYKSSLPTTESHNLNLEIKFFLLS